MDEDMNPLTVRAHRDARGLPTISIYDTEDNEMGVRTGYQP